jgi:hypothetical protein
LAVGRARALRVSLQPATYPYASASRAQRTR